MSEPETLSVALEAGGPEAASALEHIANGASPSPEQFEAQVNILHEFIESAEAPNLVNAATIALATVIERTELPTPDPLVRVAPLVLPSLIRALAAVPAIPQLPAALESLWLADRSETDQALRQWGLANADPGVRLAALDQLETWISGLNGRFAFRKFTPMVVSLLRDTSEPVRSSAYRILVQFFATTSARAREELAEIMRKQHIDENTRDKVIAAVYQRVEDQGPKSSRSSSSSRSGSPPAHTTASPAPTPASTSSSTSETGTINRDHSESHLELDLDVLKEPAYAIQPVEPANIYSENEFLDEIASRLPCFEGKETEFNWSQRQDAVQYFRRMLRCQYVTISVPTIREALRMLLKPFSDVLLSLRTTLVGFTCQALKDVALMFPQHSVPELLDAFLEPLAHVAAGIKKITATAAHLTTCSIVIQSPTISARQFHIIKNTFQSKKPHARAYALYWLKCSLVTSTQPLSGFEDKESEIEQITIKGITDAMPPSRDLGRQVYWVLHELWPILAQRIGTKLAPNAVKSLQLSKPKSKKPSSEGSSLTNAVSSEDAAPPQQGSRLVIDSQRANVIHKEHRRSPQTPVMELKRRQVSTPTSRSSHRDVMTPIGMPRRPASESVAMSESMAELNLGGSSSGVSSPLQSPTETVLSDPKAVEALVRQNGALYVLKKLAVSGVTPAVSTKVLRVVREHASEVSSAADIAKLVHMDLNGASVTQRAGYLQLLGCLNYDQDTLDSFRTAHSPSHRSTSLSSQPSQSSLRPASEKTEQVAIYADTNMSSANSSPSENHTSRSDLSRSSVSSPASSLKDSDAEMSPLGLRDSIDVVGAASLSSLAIGPFPSTEPACKAYIEGLVQQVEEHKAGPSVIATLAALVTASSTPPSRKSPFYTAIDVWRRSYTFGMHLRDVILDFLGKLTDAQSVIATLVLLRALIVTPTQAPVNAYLDPIVSVRCLLQVSQTHGGKLLEIDEHALPAARDAVMQAGRSFGSRSLLELLVSFYDKAADSTAKAFIVQTLEMAVANTNLLIDEGAGILPLVVKALGDDDATVRKEAYPVLVTIHRQNEILGSYAQTRLKPGQRRLLAHCLNIS